MSELDKLKEDKIQGIIDYYYSDTDYALDRIYDKTRLVGLKAMQIMQLLNAYDIETNMVKDLLETNTEILQIIKDFKGEK